MRIILAAIFVTAFVVAVSVCVGGCGSASLGHDPRGGDGVQGEFSSIAVSSTYFAAAVRDLIGEETSLLVLAEPGMCPGHSDVRPSQIRHLRSCTLMVRFDFQQGLDSRLGDVPNSLRIVAVRMPGGMCETEGYVSTCRQVADALIDAGLISPEQAEERLADIVGRMHQLASWADEQLQTSGLEGAPVLSSGHQAAFCRRLGLNVAGTFSAADTARPGQIDEAVKRGSDAGVRLIIANLPEGRQLADALADRLGAKVAVFGNFPAAGDSRAFDDLFRHNVTSLLEAATP